MMHEIHGIGTIDPASFDTLRSISAEAWPAQLAHLQEMSLASGMEVIYDMSMFGEDWSPAFRHDSSDPVAWVCKPTGRRVEGSKRPA